MRLLRKYLSLFIFLLFDIFGGFSLIFYFSFYVFLTLFSFYLIINFFSIIFLKKIFSLKINSINEKFELILKEAIKKCGVIYFLCLIFDLVVDSIFFLFFLKNLFYLPIIFIFVLFNKILLALHI